MVDWVHSHTTSLGPGVAFDCELVLGTGGLCKAQLAPAHGIGRDRIDDVLNSGLSVLPPPATMPIMPLALLLMTFFAPLGSLTLVLPSSGL